jgi:hypothetical protein
MKKIYNELGHWVSEEMTEEKIIVFVSYEWGKVY